MAGEITVYDIARLAEVSVATVSRVINNYPYVGKETRAKVLKVISETGFVQNNAARSLATKATKMVGILISDIRTSHHTDGVYFIEHEFSRNGYSCLIYNTGSDPDQMAHYLQVLGQRQVDAVVLIGSVYQNITVQNAIMVHLSDTPVAICNGYLDGPNIYGVLADEKGGVRDAVRTLANKGRRHFVFVSNGRTPSNLQKEEGFLEGYRLYVQDGSCHSIVVQDGSFDDICAATDMLLCDYPETDAIIYSEDSIALAGLHELVEKGVDIPGRIAVMGMNNSKYSTISNPSLSTIDNMLHDTSLIAVRNLLEVLKGEPVNHKMSIGAQVIERSST